MRMINNNKIIGIDLSQHLPCISSLSYIKSKAMPVALLPFYPSEEAIFGFTAFTHRRSLGWEWPPEARITLANEQGTGSGRVPIISAFASMLDSDRDWGGINNEKDSFAWYPEGKKICKGAPYLIVGTSIGLVSSQTETAVLVIPDTFQEHSQNKLNTLVKSLSKNRFQLKSIPRSIALALKWVQEFESSELITQQGYVGHLRVCSFGLDEWTINLIPLKSIAYESKNYLVPIFIPSNFSSSLGIWGITFSCFSAFVEKVIDDSLEIWSNVITGEYIHQLLKGSIKELKAHGKLVWSAANNLENLVRFENCVSQLPHCTPIPKRLLTQNEIIKEAENIFKRQHCQLPKGAESLIGTIIDGSFSKISFLEDKDIGTFFSQYNIPNNVDRKLLQKNFHQSLACEGAAIFGEKLLLGIPTYQMTLTPIDIYCRKANEAIWEWVPLIKGDVTLDAGKSEELQNISGFSIQKGMSEVIFNLRRPLIDNEEAIYRKIKAKLSKPTEDVTPVKLVVKVKPGEGYAQIEVNSYKGERLAELDWSSMEKCEEPQSPKIGYLPYLNSIVQCPELWKDVEEAFTALQELKNKNTIKFQNALEALQKALKGNYFNKEKPHISFGPIPTSDDQLENLSLRAIQDQLFALFMSTENSKSKTIASNCLNWLYLNAPKKYKEELRNYFYCEVEEVKQWMLNGFGRIFHQKDDILFFYQLLERKSQASIDKPTYWLIALNNILRFHPEALCTYVVSSEYLTKLIEWILKILFSEIQKKKCGPIALRSVHTVSYLLYRRKYEPSFLVNDSELFTRIVYAFQEIKKLNLTDRKKSIIDLALAFLKTEATEADATIVYESFSRDDLSSEE